MKQSWYIDFDHENNESTFQFIFCSLNWGKIGDINMQQFW